VEIGSQLKPAIAPSGRITLCAGDSVELDAGSGYASYAWSSGETSERIVVRSAGRYAVHVIDASGCSGTSDSVGVEVRALPVVTITPVGPITIHRGDSAELDAGGGYAGYAWSTGATTRRIMVNDSGSYAVRVIDTNGCRAGATVIVTVDETKLARAVVAVDNVIATPGEHLEVGLRLLALENLPDTIASTFEARLRYHASLLIPDEASRGAIEGEDRVMTVTGTLPAGMTSGELARLRFIAALGDTDRGVLALEGMKWFGAGGVELNIYSVLSSASIKLAGLCTNGGARLVRAGGSQGLKALIPNPASGGVRIIYDLLEEGRCRIAITDLLGSEVAQLFAGDRTSGTYEAEFDARSLPAGLYVVMLETPSGRASTMMRIVR
jgi:hypothetical protein